MDSIQKWLDRVKNLIDVQTSLQMTDISVRLSRFDLIELRGFFTTLKELNIYGCDLKIGEIISCESTREWVDLTIHLQNEGYELEFFPEMKIKIIGKNDTSI